MNTSNIGSGLRKYLDTSRTATYAFLSALPLLATYEILIAFVNRGTLREVRVGAEVWIKQLVAMVGGTGFPVLAILVVGVGIAVLFAERKRRPPIVPKYFLWMVGEGLAYAVLLAVLVGSVVGALFAFAPQGTLDQHSGLAQLALSLGAGLYEELVFRVILVGGLFWLFRRLLRKSTAEGTRVEQKTLAYIAAAVVGALAFSSVHYLGVLGDAFTLSSFTFRFLFGLALNAVFLLRGFGVAAWTHALYDVLVVVGVWG
jgi:membrane protease YdiL (CAAX protease family)